MHKQEPSTKTDYRAVFLDKDGTLIENVPYNVDPKRVRLMRGAKEALSRLHKAGYGIVVCSNQSGVAHGYFEEAALEPIRRRIIELFAEFQVPLSGFYYCPHLPDAQVPKYRMNCSCRKPQPGMIQRAAQDHRLDLRESWFIGDILDDVEAGRRAGCRTILIHNGNEDQWQLTLMRRPDFEAKDLLEAAEFIVAHPAAASKSR